MAHYDEGGRDLMKAVTKIIFFDENNEKFFGEGPISSFVHD